MVGKDCFLFYLYLSPGGASPRSEIEIGQIVQEFVSTEYSAASWRLGHDIIGPGNIVACDKIDMVIEKVKHLEKDSVNFQQSRARQCEGSLHHLFLRFHVSPNHLFISPNRRPTCEQTRNKSIRSKSLKTFTPFRWSSIS